MAFVWRHEWIQAADWRPPRNVARPPVGTLQTGAICVPCHRHFLSAAIIGDDRGMATFTRGSLLSLNPFLIVSIWMISTPGPSSPPALQKTAPSSAAPQLYTDLMRPDQDWTARQQ